jgi:PAS domain S-box-containing protein
LRARDLDRVPNVTILPSLESVSATTGRASILLVDDHPANLLALEALLEPLEQDLVRASSGEAALKIMEDREFAVVLLDVRMPGLNGFETAKRFRQRDKDRHTPVIFVTAADVDEADHELAYSRGAVDFLVKPFRPAALLSKVRVFVDLYLKGKTIAAQAAALRQAEREVLERQSESRLQTIIDLMPLCVVALHADGTPYFCNRAWREYTGIELDQASPTTLLDALHPDDLPRAREALQGAFSGGRTVELECRLRSAHDGGFRWHIARALPEIGANGGVVGWIATATDVEQQKQAERQAIAANRTKDEFLAVVSHDLRTPLTAILGWAGMLSSANQDPAKLRRGIETILRNARAQALLIDDILDIARIISGKLRLEPSAVDIKAVVQGALEAVDPSAQAKEVTLETHLHPVPPTSGDPARLQQVVWNLAMNAVKFTPKGGTVQVHVNLIDGDIQIQVRDNGRGIDPEFLPHVFDRFRQADSTPARAQGGLGLGLAIVDHIVGLHGGSVVVESAGPGRGATFTVRLPVREPTATDAPGVEASSPELREEGTRSETLLRGVLVLVVDDDADSRDFITQVLTSAGADVVSAASSREALNIFHRSPPNVLVSDIGLAGQDGYSIIREIRALAKDEGGMVRAAALTAYTREQDASRALDAGFDVHIAKPVDPLELVGIVAELAGQRR